MIRYLLLAIVYVGTILLLGTIPVCLFCPSEMWLRILFTGLYASILVGFLLKIFVRQPVLPRAKGLEYYLWKVGNYIWGWGYCLGTNADDYASKATYDYQGKDKRTYIYLNHWFLMMVSYLMLLHLLNVLQEQSLFIVEWGHGMIWFLVLYNICLPFYGIFWRSCFEQPGIPEHTNSDESTPSERAPSLFARIPPVYYDIFFQWLWFDSVFIALVVVCHLKFSILTVLPLLPQAIMLTVILFCWTNGKR